METLKELVKRGDTDGTVERVRELLQKDSDVGTILNTALIPAMDEVGELFQKREYFIPEMLIAARAMKGAMEVLKPLLTESGVKSRGNVVLGTAKGDLHDIGKNLVAMTFEGAGFEVIDLGVDVPSAKFVEAVKEHDAIAIGISALLTTTMQEARKTIEEIGKEGLRDRVKILIGGAAVNQAFADEIGADFFGPDPASGKDYLRSQVG
ncbi:corrinoid protein [Thermodesulfobacteriota bacterium]